MTSDLVKLMETISMLQSEPTPEPIIEIEKPTMHPLLQAMQELKEDGIVEAKESIKDQLEKAYIQDGGSIDEYFVRSSKVDKLGFSPKQIFARSPDLDHPKYDIDYIGNSVGDPALWFYPLSYYLKSPEVFTKGYPYIWLVKLKPDAWLQPVDKLTKTKQDAPKGMERVGILRKALTPSAIFFKPAFDVIDKFYDYGSQHKRHGEVKGAPVDEEIAYHGSTDDITEFHPLSHFGTDKAAKDRMEYKKIKDGKIYKVDLDIKNPLTIKDFPGIHYDRLYAFELRDKKLISQKEMEAITTIEDKQELRKALLTKLNELGIDGFVYKNKYEDKGNLSYVIVDPSQVKVLSVEPAAEEVTEEFTFNQPRRQLNIPALIKQGAIFVTHPHGTEGWETDRPDWDFSLITLQNILQKSPKWVSNYKKYISSDKKLTQDFINRISDEKYQQILWSIDKLNIPDNVAFTDKLDEASPNTLEGSFTPDLVESKTWLAEMLAKGLKGKNAGTIYVLGSWYGNMGIFLQQAGVQFDKLVLVEPDEEALMRSKDLLQQIGDEGKLILIHQKAEDVVYEKPGVVINTSCNETGPVFLTKLPDNMLCLLQARNNNENTLFPTEDEEDFIDYFPLEKVYYTGKKQLEDPEINYVRYMKIGRTGKKLDEELHTGGSLGLPFPGTYEQEYDMFKSKGPRRITAMTNESEKSFPNIVDTIVKNIPNVNEIYFHGSRAIGKGKRKSDWDILVIVDDSVVGPDYIDTVFALQDIAKEFKNFDIQPSKANNHISRIAKEEGRLLYSATHKIDEALDSSYPYEFKNNAYYFITDAGTDYKVTFKGDKKVEVSFMARGENNQPKDDITGTGDSRKVFGTVINIVKDYVGQHQPDILMFAADNNEPSRIRLYNMLASQAGKALPGYNFVKTLKGSLFTTFYLTRDNIKVPKLDTVKNVAGRVLDKVVESES
jgi:predicted nucleotidyltransferase